MKLLRQPLFIPCLIFTILDGIAHLCCSGERTTPAAVAFSNGEWVMGEAALQNKAKNPKSFFSNLLPLVGTKVSDAVWSKLTKGVKASKQADGQVLLQPCNTSGEPEGSPKLAGEMLTMLLEWFKRLAEENAGGSVGPCVLTVSRRS
jgi:molecular chaperone DnaK (HSP70)